MRSAPASVTPPAAGAAPRLPITSTFVRSSSAQSVAAARGAVPREPRGKVTPAEGVHVEAGLVRDVQYVGPVTRYHVTLDRGGELQMLTQNLEEGSSEVLASKGRRLRLQWRPEHESVIVETEEGNA